jgi:hypothetical protein
VNKISQGFGAIYSPEIRIEWTYNVVKLVKKIKEVPLLSKSVDL